MAGITNVLDCGAGTCYGSDPNKTGQVSAFSTWSSVMHDIDPTGVLTFVTDVQLCCVTLTGTYSSGAAALNWTSAQASNTNETTQYTVYREVYDGTTTTQQAWYSTTGTSYTDTSVQVRGNATSTAPSGDWVAYWIVAYNAGVGTISNTVYFSTPYM